MQPLPTTYAVIPAIVRYDTALSPAARLLYGEITALCAQRGYCWATNDYFARLYQVRRATVSAWVQQLIERGYLVATTNGHNQRHLRPADHAVEASGFPQAPERFSAPPIPPNRTAYPEISFTEMEALLLGKKNDTREWEGGAAPAFEVEVKGELDANGAVPPPIPPVALVPLPAPLAASTGPFKCPSQAEVAAYLAQQPGISEALATAEATRFCNYYQANGWRVGRHPMADWPAAARNWLLNADRFKASATASSSPSAATRLHSGGTKNYHEPL